MKFDPSSFEVMSWRSVLQRARTWAGHMLLRDVHRLGSIHARLQRKWDELGAVNEDDERIWATVDSLELMQGDALKRIERLDGGLRSFLGLLGLSTSFLTATVLNSNTSGVSALVAFVGFAYLLTAGWVAVQGSEAAMLTMVDLHERPPISTETAHRQSLIRAIDRNRNVSIRKSNHYNVAVKLTGNGIVTIALWALLSVGFR